jgi:lysophospholipase L1-like esterase
MTVLVNGCSFTEGLSLQSTELAWPGQLGKLLNQPVVNLALGGASNSRINRTTIEYLSINPTPELVIIGWTAIDRDELSYSQGQYLRLTSNDCLVDNKNELPNDLGHIHKFWATELHNEYINFRDWIYLILHLQDYFKEKDIKFLFFLALGNNYIKEFVNESTTALYLANKSQQRRDQNYNLPCRKTSQYKELYTLVNKIDLSNWVFGNNNTMLEYLNKKKFSLDHTNHFKEDGHRHWAKIIYDNLL